MTPVVEHKPDYSSYPRLSLEAAREAAGDLLAMRGEGAAVGDATLVAIERFIRKEARLLDEQRLEDWYALLADDLFYWMPVRENRFRRDARPPISPDNMALFDDSKADMAMRIARMASNMVWSEDPPSRHVYMVGNVEAFETSVPDSFEVHSVFAQYRNRSEHDETILYGRRRDRLRRVGEGDFRLVRRLILLPQSVLLTKNLSVFF